MLRPAVDRHGRGGDTLFERQQQGQQHAPSTPAPAGAVTGCHWPWSLKRSHREALALNASRFY
jgi:hypothetical protein